jgi:predicted nucleotidyltransferase
MEVRSVEAIVKALNDAEVKYLIVGGLAVVAHGYERLTQDVDLVINLEPSNIVRGLHTLISIGYQLSIPITPEDFANPDNRENWKNQKGMIVLKLWSDIHRRTPIDVFIDEPFDFAHEHSLARWEKVMGEIKAPVVRYETLIAMKRLAGRLQDLADIADLEEVQKLKHRFDIHD